MKRLLADPRSEALALAVRGAVAAPAGAREDQCPIRRSIPYYDYTLGAAMATETRAFFENLVREDRSVLELLTADYTFVNERLAAHYGIPDVSGAAFRRVLIARRPARRFSATAAF